MQVAGDQLQLRVVVGRPARVGHRHPPVEVGLGIVSRDGQHVVGHPRHVRRQVRRLDPMLALAAVVDLPHQRRPAVQVLGDLGEAVLVGVHAGDDLVADLPHRRVVEGQQPRADFFLAAGAVVHARADERDVAADVLLQQPLRVEQVELVVLFEDAEAGWLAERAEVDGGRVHRRRDVEKAQVDNAVRQRHLPHVAHQRDVGVVDGNGQFGLVLDGRRDDVVLSGLDGLHRRRCAAGGQQSQCGNAQKRAGRTAPEWKGKSHLRSSVAPDVAPHG